MAQIVKHLKPIAIETITASPFRFETVVHEETKHIQVARLAHGLERTLFSPGIHVLKDARTNHFNFDPFLETITQPEDFNFDALPPYKVASGDPILRELSLKHGQKYFSSTSSITGLLSKFYGITAQFRGIDMSRFTVPFASEPSRFTAMQRKSTSAILKFHDGVYSIDQEKGDEEDPPVVKGNEILMALGKSMEKLLTAPKEEYNTYLKSAKLSEGHVFPTDEAFHYANIEGFLLRSQLDCWDDRLPYKSFDIKTRVTLPVRMDPEHYKDHVDYKLTTLHGKISSYEREFYDMSRSAMLKYNLQVRIGNMDGIFIAYHNTQEMFGFQYLSREEMNKVLYGSCTLGDKAFALSCKGLERVLDTVVKRDGHWGKDLRITVKTVEKSERLDIYIEPIANQASECTGPLTKFTFQVKSNSHSLLRDASTVKDFDPEKWTIEYELKEVEHRDGPTQEELKILNKLQTEQEEGQQKGVRGGTGHAALFLETLNLVAREYAFAGESEEAGSDSAKKRAGRSLYIEYTNVRDKTPNLNRDKEARANDAFVKALKREARQSKKERFVEYECNVGLGGGNGGGRSGNGGDGGSERDWMGRGQQSKKPTLAHQRPPIHKKKPSKE
ncbi:UNVERIFIED_CONTAM: hypothetical protein HDU68_011559 [Siphonaria sp. JEL0065]|nr:hypothetical protein HDU68_011559 [Siphonaria sp. JEL0065]